MSKREPSIRLHKEFGVNPTMPVCVICGKETGEIAMLGAAYKGQAPMHMIVGMSTCPSCNELLKGGGVALIGALPNEGVSGDVVHPGEFTFTGDAVVLKEEAFRRLFKAVGIPARRMVLVEPEVLRALQVEPEGGDNDEKKTEGSGGTGGSVDQCGA